MAVPVGSEFQINLLTQGNQTNPAIATNAAGQTIIVWEDTSDRDGDSSSIYARLYDASGNPVTGDFRVNTFTSSSQNTPAVAIDASGNFVVTWTSFGQIGVFPEFTEVYAQQFASNGTTIGSETLVNTTTNSFQSNSAIAMDSSGNYVIVWESLDQDGDGFGVYTRRFNAGGAPISGEVLVNATTAGEQGSPDVAMNSAGNYVIVWDGAGASDTNGVFAQLYNSAGVPQGSAILVNTLTTGIQGGASVAIDPDGNFIVVWTDQNGVGSGDILARRFNNAGAPIGSDFIVNTTLPGFQTQPDITIDSTGNFTITWTGGDASGGGVFARQYNSAGVASGNEFLVNTVTTNEQGVSAIASGNNGNLTIAYASGDTLTSTLDILAQRYGPPPTVQFSQATYQIGENGVPVGIQLTLNRSGAVVGVTSQVQLSITGGTAQGGATAGGGNDYNNTGFPRTITFDAGETTQTIAIPIFQDLLIEPGEAINLQISSLSNATIGTQNTATLQILDDDPQYVVDDETPIVPEGNTGVIPITFVVTRSGNTAATSIDFSFSGTATNGVDYSLTGITGAGITVTGNTINFAIGATAATLNVNIIGDQIDESNEVIQVNLSNPSPFGTVTVPSVTTTIADNDTAGITVTQSAGSTDVAEGGATDTYTIALTSVPTAAVAVALTPTAQLDLGGGAGVPIVINFAADVTALTGQTLTVTAVDDLLVEGSQTSTISYSVSSPDPGYDGQLIPTTIVNIADNDVGYTLSATTASTPEGNLGTTPITFTITRSGAIDSASAVDLSFGGSATNGTDYSLVSGTGTGVTLTGNTVNFAANSTTATITLDSVGDQVVETNETIQLSLSNATAPGSAIVTGSPATTTLINDDVAGVAIVQTGGSTDTTEGGATDTYTIALTSAPTAAVTVTLTPDAQINLGNGAGIALVLTFAADGTALTPQTVTVTAIDDAGVEGNHTGIITQTVSSTDVNYNSFPVATITTNITDNDISYAIAAGVTTVTEGNTGSSPITFTITRSGATNVTSAVDFAPGGTATNGTDYTLVGATGTGISLAGNTITFAANATTATLTLNVTGDQVAEADETIQVSLANAIAPGTVTITTGSATTTIANDDTAGINVVQTGGTTSPTEGGATDTYTIALTSVPTAAVTITITPTAQINLGSGAGTPITLTFAADATALNPQTVTVTAVDDIAVEGNLTTLITHTLSSTDPSYNGLSIADISVDLIDNDISYAIAATTSTILEGNSGSSPITFTVTRSGATTAASTIDFALAGTATNGTDYNNPAISGTGITLTGNTINFAAGATTATLTLNGLGDQIAEPDETVTVILNNPTAPGTASITTGSATTTLTNDDLPGITVNQSGGTTTVAEGGVFDTYTIALNSIPTAPVTVAVAPSPQLNLGSGAGNPITLTFPAGPAALVAQTVTVAAIDNPVIDGNRTVGITHVVSSADPNYNNLAIANISVNLADNDVGYAIAANTASLAEGDTGTTPIAFTVTRSGVTNTATTVNFTLSGTAVNGIDYTIAGVTGIGISSTGNTINFAAGATTATIALTVDSDRVQEPDQTIITSLTNPTAPGTATLITSSANTIITNDDTAGVIVTPSGSSTVLAEGGATDTYEIALATVPTGTIEITIQSDAGSEISLDGTTFAQTQVLTRSDTTPLTVTVRALDDRFSEGTHPTTITHSITGVVTDPNYPTSLVIAPIPATITDNEQSASHRCLPGVRLIGTPRNDSLRGSRNSDVIQGRAGNDRLLGRGCDDRISGSLGNDFIWGGEGNDLLTGGSQQDVLNGGDGNDFLGGGPNRDRLIGGNGRDMLRGGKGVDILMGGTGNDILMGGNLNDRMTGGTGADRFVYQTLAEAGDRITDFNAKQDVIDLRQLSRSLGDRRLSFFGPDLKLVQTGSSTEVRIDPDGTLGSSPLTTLVVLENVNAADLSARNFLS